MDERYCYVIVEDGRPMFVSMVMSKASCETMMAAMGEGEVVTVDVGLTYKRAMVNHPAKNPADPDGLWPLEIVGDQQSACPGCTNRG